MISRITKEDHKDVNKLIKQTFNDDYKTVINLGFKYSINNKLIAVILYSYYQRQYNRYCYIDILAVDKSYQNKGIGSILLNKVINLTSADVRLSIDVSNLKHKDLMKFYTKKKFKEVGKNKLGNIIMQLSRK